MKVEDMSCSAIMRSRKGEKLAVAFWIPAAFWCLMQLSTPAAASRLQILYPLYIDPPSSSWTKIAGLAKQYKGRVAFSVVVNVVNGPDTARNSDYADGIKALKASGNVKVLGYVATGIGQCFNWSLTANHGNAKKCKPTDFGPSNPLPNVYQDLHLWVKFYGRTNMDGFFLDEFLPYSAAADDAGPAALKSALQDYADLYKYIKAKFPGYAVVGNPGYVDPRFKTWKAKVADAMTIEESISDFLRDPKDPEKGSLAFYPPGYRKGVILHSVVGSTMSQILTKIQRAINLSVSWGAQYFVVVRSYDAYPADFFASEVYRASRVA